MLLLTACALARIVSVPAIDAAKHPRAKAITSLTRAIVRWDIARLLNDLVGLLADLAAGVGGTPKHVAAGKTRPWDIGQTGWKRHHDAVTVVVDAHLHHGVAARVRERQDAAAVYRFL